MPKFSPLKDCTNLVSLSLGGFAPIINTIDLEKKHEDILREMCAWLKNCKQLRFLAITDFIGAPALMAQILLDNIIQLTSLEYEGSVIPDAKEFYQALVNQKSLEILSLKEYIGPLVFRLEPVEIRAKVESAGVLVEYLSKLVNLTELRLTASSNFFIDRHIEQLASSLPKLEVWSTRGYRLTDAVWSEVASLKSLRSLDFGAVTNFTVSGIVDFIKKLGPGNKGLVLSTINQENFESKRVFIKKISNTLAKETDGWFGFTLDSPRVTRGDYRYDW